MAAVFLKVLKMDFLEKATFKFIFFRALPTPNGLQILQVSNFFLLKKKIFEKKSKLLIFSKTTEEKDVNRNSHFASSPI